MKRFIFSIVIFLGTLISTPGVSFAEEGERIRIFDSVVEVEEGGIFNVTETIIYDFGDNERRGIFRIIPKTYLSDGDKYRIRAEFSPVTDEGGQSYPSRSEDTRGDYRLRIGDPDKLITGAHTYVIRYTIKGAISPYEDFDEIYWNATGNEWGVPIDEANLRVILPTEINSEAIDMHCYRGLLGNSQACESASVSVDKGNTIVRFSDRDLGVGAGLTGAVGFPKGVVLEPVRESAELPDTLVRGLLVAFGAGILVFVAWSISHWRKFGRDPEGRGVVVRQYDAPKGMMPGEVGIIVDERIDNRDITAEIVYLAEQGLMHILAIPRTGFLARGSSYYLLKLRESDDTLKSYQKILFKHLFSGRRTMSSLEVDELKKDVEKNDKIKVDLDKILSRIKTAKEITAVDELSKSTSNPFYVDLKEVKEELSRSAVSAGLFVKNPSEVRSKYGMIMVAGGGLFFLLFLLFVGLQNTTLLITASVAGIVVFTVGAILTSIMVQKTEKGVAVREHSLGLKEYLSIAEKDRLEFHFNPKNNPDLFEKLLPFAIALGVEKQWAKELDDIQIDPGWYSDAGSSTLTVAAFNNSFSGFNSASMATYSAASAAGSAGGGFSGGGAGGGGGGSW